MNHYTYSLHRCPLKGPTPNRHRHITSAPAHELTRPGTNWYWLPRIKEWRVKEAPLKKALGLIPKSDMNRHQIFLDALNNPETPAIAIINEQIKDLLQIRSNLHCKGKESTSLTVKIQTLCVKRNNLRNALAIT